MAKEEAIVLEGVVVEALPGTKFIVEILPTAPTEANEGDEETNEEAAPESTSTVNESSNPDSKHLVRASISGRMRMNYIKINPGDRVTVELSPYDLTKGRITYRHK